jgi:hypothetical protein
MMDRPPFHRTHPHRTTSADRVRLSGLGVQIGFAIAVLLVSSCGADTAASSRTSADSESTRPSAGTAEASPTADPVEQPATISGSIEVELDGVDRSFDEFAADDPGYRATQLGGLLFIEARDEDGASFRIMTSNIDLAALELPAVLRDEDLKQFGERIGRQPQAGEMTKLRSVGFLHRNAEGIKFTSGIPKPTLTIEHFDGRRIRGGFVGILHGRKAGQLEMVNGRFDVTLAGP